MCACLQANDWCIGEYLAISRLFHNGVWDVGANRFKFAAVGKEMKIITVV